MVAPDQSVKRPLRFWEQVCSFMGVSMGFELEGKITADNIKQAYALLQKEFPYLRCVLTQDANVLSFVERSPAPVRVPFNVLHYDGTAVLLPKVELGCHS